MVKIGYFLMTKFSGQTFENEIFENYFLKTILRQNKHA